MTAKDSGENLVGIKFNRLLVLEKIRIRDNRRIYYLCECDCGKFIITRSDSLKNNNSRSCGCLQKEELKEKHLIDETGKIFNNLTVIKLKYCDKERGALWLCQCKCGNYIDVYGEHLRRNETVSCGCLH